MEDKEQKIKIQFDTNANKTAEEVRKLESATIKVEEAEIKLKKANEALTNSTGKSVEEIRNLEIAQKKAAIATEDAKSSVEKLSNTQQKAEKSTKSLGENIQGLDNPISGAISGFKALLVQMFAIVANPIGAVLALIVGAVTLLGKAFFSTEANGNKLQKGLAVISGLFSGLLKVLEPVATFLVDNIIKSFTTAGNVILATSALLQKGLRALGLDSAANGLKGLTDAVDGNIKASGKLADAEAKLVDARRVSSQTQLDFQNKAEKIRQKRDNDSNLSIAKRAELNAQLAAVLKQQSLEELRLANLAKTVSDIRIKQEGKSSANLDERAAALLQISDINERISGQESEQLANANSLRNEQKALDKEAAAAKAAADKVIEDARLALIKEGIDKENALRLANEDLLDKTDEQKLKRLKERAAEEVEVLRAKNINVEQITILNAAKFDTLEKELEAKRIEEQRVKDEAKFAKDVEKKATEAANEKLDFENRLIILAERDALILANTALTEEERNKLLKENVEVRANIEKAEQDFKESQLQNNLGNLQNILSVGGKKMQNVAKALAIADVVRTSAKSVSESVSGIGAANALALATPAAVASLGATAIPVIAANTIQGGLQIGSTIASATKAIQSITSGGRTAPSGGGASGGRSGGGGSSASATPQVAFQASSENQIGNTVANNLNSQPPIQAFVVSKDVSDAQQLDNNKINSNSI